MRAVYPFYYLALASLSLCLGARAADWSAWTKIEAYLGEVRPGAELANVEQAFDNLEAAKAALPQAKQLKLDESALKLLVSLAGVRNDKKQFKCNAESLDIFTTFERNSPYGLASIWGDKLMANADYPRIARILRLVAHDHALYCRQFYRKKWESRRHEIDSVLESSINAFEPDKSDCDRGRNYCLVKLIHRGIWRFTDRPWANGYAALERLAKDDPDARYLRGVATGEQQRPKQKINVEKFTKLYQRYLVQPCADYLEFMADPLGVLEYDWRSLSHEEFLNIVEDERNTMEFFKDWARYEVCADMIRSRTRFLNALIEHAESLE